MEIFDIVAPRKYDRNGETKTFWGNVGRLVKFPAREDKAEGYIIELNMFPNTEFKVFAKNQDKPTAPTVDEMPSAPQDTRVQYEDKSEIPF